MTFQYDPKLAYSCFPPGKYPATLTAVVEGMSRKGLPMLTLTFDVKSGDRSRKIRGWVANPTSLFMLKELAYAVDQGARFEDGSFDAEACLGAEVIVELRVTTTDGWGEQNTIEHYHRSPHGQPIKAVRSTEMPAKSGDEGEVSINMADMPF